MQLLEALLSKSANSWNPNMQAYCSCKNTGTDYGYGCQVLLYEPLFIKFLVVYLTCEHAMHYVPHIIKSV